MFTVQGGVLLWLKVFLPICPDDAAVRADKMRQPGYWCRFLLAGKIGRQRFVCGLICGAFYALCLLAAAFLVHGVPSWTRSDAMLPLALLLGGTLGGALSAIKEGH